MKAILGFALLLVLAGAGVYFGIKNPLIFDYLSLFYSQANAQLEKSTWEDDIEIETGGPMRESEPRWMLRILECVE
jgi:hypothetical protein